jgi:hypothetical protein
VPDQTCDDTNCAPVVLGRRKSCPSEREPTICLRHSTSGLALRGIGHSWQAAEREAYHHPRVLPEHEGDERSPKSARHCAPPHRDDLSASTIIQLSGPVAMTSMRCGRAVWIAAVIWRLRVHHPLVFARRRALVGCSNALT